MGGRGEGRHYAPAPPSSSGGRPSSESSSVGSRRSFKKSRPPEEPSSSSRTTRQGRRSRERTPRTGSNEQEGEEEHRYRSARSMEGRHTAPPPPLPTYPTTLSGPKISPSDDDDPGLEQMFSEILDGGPRGAATGGGKKTGAGRAGGGQPPYNTSMANHRTTSFNDAEERFEIIGDPVSKDSDLSDESTPEEEEVVYATMYAGSLIYPGTLVVKIISCDSLSIADWTVFSRNGSSDPYVVVTVWKFLPTSTGVLNTTMQRTRTIYQNLDPIFNEE